MLNKIRRSVFETNSSSAHSLIMSKGSKSVFRDGPEMDEKGKMIISLGYYDWGIDRLSGFMQKLSYLATQLVQNNVYYNYEDFYDSDKKDKLRDSEENPFLYEQLSKIILLDILEDYGVKEIEYVFGDEDSYHDAMCVINHQSDKMITEALSTNGVLDKRKVLRYLTEDNIDVWVGNDNGGYPEDEGVTDVKIIVDFGLKMENDVYEEIGEY